MTMALWHGSWLCPRAGDPRGSRWMEATMAFMSSFQSHALTFPQYLPTTPSALIKGADMGRKAHKDINPRNHQLGGWPPHICITRLHRSTRLPGKIPTIALISHHILALGLCSRWGKGLYITKDVSLFPSFKTQSGLLIPPPITKSWSPGLLTPQTMGLHCATLSSRKPFQRAQTLCIFFRFKQKREGGRQEGRHSHIFKIQWRQYMESITQMIAELKSQTKDSEATAPILRLEEQGRNQCYQRKWPCPPGEGDP